MMVAAPGNQGGGSSTYKERSPNPQLKQKEIGNSQEDSLL